MRMVEIIKTFSRAEVEYKAGHKYVMAEDAESQFRSVAGDGLGLSYPIEMIYRPYKGQDLSGKRLMCWRTGGIGDMFFLIPVLRYLKKRYPTCFLRVASGCQQPLENLPEIDELYTMPYDAQLLEDVDYHLMFQGIIESSSDNSKSNHAVDMFFSYFSIDSIQFPSEDKRPHLAFTDSELSWMKTTTKGMGIEDDDYVIGMQLETSAPLRNFPKDKSKAVIDVLAREPKVKIVMIGTEQQGPLSAFYKGAYPNVIPALNFNVRQSIVLANRYDLILSPDSFMVQVAGSLGKPLVGLYGPFSSEVRMKYFKNAIGIEPNVVCSPCFKHDFRGCIKGYPSPCFTQVSMHDILQAVDFLRFKMIKRHFGYMAPFFKEPDLSEVQRYMLSADQGICFFPGYYRPENALRVDTNRFTGADITDLSTDFKRNSFPFVLYMNNFAQSAVQVYQGSKTLVRPGGYYIVYMENGQEQLFNDIKKDLGKTYVLLLSKFDPVSKRVTIVGKKPY